MGGGGARGLLNFKEFNFCKRKILAPHISVASSALNCTELKIIQVIFRPTLAYDRAKSNLVGQIYCIFAMGKPMIVCNNALK